MRNMLDRGFTSVRDTGGADWGMKDGRRQMADAGAAAVHRRPALGPHRRPQRRPPPHRLRHPLPLLRCAAFAMGLADGVAEVRKAVREEMRQGCDQVKIMMSGGVASPYDPLDSLQFSPEEVAAAVEEAHAFGRYVCAHAYSAEAITRAAQAGVRTIEHGNLIDEASAKLMASKGMYLIANLVTYYEMRNRAAEYGMSAEMLAKNDLVIDGGLGRSRSASVPAYRWPTVPTCWDNCRASSPASSASAPRGAKADRDHPRRHPDRRRDRAQGGQARLPPGRRLRRPLVVEGNPLRDLGVLQEQGKSLAAIMKGGRFSGTGCAEASRRRPSRAVQLDRGPLAGVAKSFPLVGDRSWFSTDQSNRPSIRTAKTLSISMAKASPAQRGSRTSAGGSTLGSRLLARCGRGSWCDGSEGVWDAGVRLGSRRAAQCTCRSIGKSLSRNTRSNSYERDPDHFCSSTSRMSSPGRC